MNRTQQLGVWLFLTIVLAIALYRYVHLPQ